MRKFFGWLLIVGGLILTAYEIWKLWSTGNGVPVGELQLIALVGGLWLLAVFSLLGKIRQQPGGRLAIMILIGAAGLVLLSLSAPNHNLAMAVLGALFMGTGIGVGLSTPRRKN